MATTKTIAIIELAEVIKVFIVVVAIAVIVGTSDFDLV